MKRIKAYTIVSQLIIEILVLGGLGFLIGYFINKEGILKGVLAVIGATCGIVIFVFQIVRLALEGEKDGSKQ